MTDHPLPVGTRVRHYVHQWPNAYRDGTANIVEVRGPMYDGSYEYLVSVDDGSTKPRWWPAHSTMPIRPTVVPEEQQ